MVCPRIRGRDRSYAGFLCGTELVPAGTTGWLVCPMCRNEYLNPPTKGPGMNSTRTLLNAVATALGAREVEGVLDLDTD